MDEVLAAEGIWAVFYDGKPINKQDSTGYKIIIRFNQLRKVVSV